MNRTASFLPAALAICLLLAPRPCAGAVEDRTPGPASEGNDLVRRAAERLLAHASIQARVRQRVALFDQKLVGSGSYSQLLRGTDLLFRMDLKLQMGERAATWQQVADGRFLWIYRDLPDLEKLGSFRTELQRVDLDAVRRASGALPEQGVIPGMTMHYGGLPRLLQQLSRHFQFQPPQPKQLHGVPVWTTQGRWRAASLQKLYGIGPSEPGAQAAPVLVPPLPHEVEVTFGQEDLFPYRLEYHRRRDDGGKHGAGPPEGGVTSRPIMILELFEVQLNAPLDVSQFERRAGDLPVMDQTEKFLRRHGISPDRPSPKAPLNNKLPIPAPLPTAARRAGERVGRAACWWAGETWGQNGQLELKADLSSSA